MPLGVPPIRGKGVTEGTQRATLGVVTPERPVEFILVGRMRPQFSMDEMQDQIITEARIPRDRVHVQRGIEYAELEQLRGNRHFFALIGGAEIVGQN